jgi:hypothetical protein
MLKSTALILLSVLIFFLSGCEIKPEPPKQPVIDKTLPQVGDIKFLTEVSAIGFEWEPSFDGRVEGYYIYRSTPNSQSDKLQRVATIDDKYSSHYVDTKLQPETMYYYRFSTFSKEKRESVPSETVSASTLPLLESVSFVKAITGLPHRIKIIWRPHASQRVEAYLVEKNEFNSTQWKQIAKVNGRLSAEYIDAGLEGNHMFRYRIKAQTYDGLISKPSQIVEAGTKPLPKMVKGLSASYDIPKKVSLKWEAATEKDFSYYKIYRTLNPLLFDSYLAKTQDTSYEDLINANGRSYYYVVTSVDKDGLESLKQEVSTKGGTLTIPAPVYITSSSHDGRSITLAWKNQDGRAIKYNVSKEFSQKWSDKKEVITGIPSTSFNDTDVIRGVEYKYNVVAIDKYGLSSEDSQSILIKMPKE